MIHDENNVLTDDELVILRRSLKNSKCACLYIRNKHPRGFKLFSPYIKMDKIPKKVTKDSKKHKTGRKTRQKILE